MGVWCTPPAAQPQNGRMVRSPARAPASSATTARRKTRFWTIVIPSGARNPRPRGRGFLAPLGMTIVQNLVFRRAVVALLAGALAGLLTILPFWGWAAGGVHQTPIPHPTRTNYLFDFGTPAVFFWQVYGVTPALALYGLIRGQRRRLWALAAIALFLGSLGLGGTTPLPSLLFRSQADWLTYDRFALWAAVLLLPLTGVALAWL